MNFNHDDKLKNYGRNKSLDIYKNLMRDIKMHLTHKYHNFLEMKNIDKNHIYSKSAFFPTLTKQFVT